MNNKIRSFGKSTLRTLAISAFAILFLVGVVLFYYNMVCSKERELIIKNGETSAMQTAAEFNNYLSTSLDAIKMTAYTLDGMLTDGRSDGEILDYLVGQSNAIMNTVFENTTGMYGYINGRFVSGSNWTPPAGFNAVERPWYIKAMASGGEVAIIEPYLDAQTGKMMMALAKTLCDGESVVAFDMTLDKIQSITEEAVSSDLADSEFIIDGSGSVIAHSDKSEVDKNYGSETGTLGAEIFEKIGSAKDNYFEIDHAPSRYIVYTTKIQNDWICVSVKDTTSVFASITVIFLVTIIVVIAIVAIVAGMSVNSARRSIIAARLSKQLSSTADIYISLHEIDFVNDTFVEVINNKSEASKMIGETRNNCQQTIRTIMTKFSDESTRDSILDFVDFSRLDERLKDRNTITTEFLSAEGKWRRARYIVSARLADGRVSNAMYLIEDIDAEKRERDNMQDTAKLLSFQLGSIANIYTSVHDVDIPNNSFTIIKMNDSVVQTAIGNDIHNAQQVIRDAMMKLTDESCRKEVMEFIEFSNVEKNVAETGTATVEFINSRGKWCRGRFIVAERTADGGLSHVIWAVENIDTEKRAREAISAEIENLNTQMASISNIYMTVFDIDLFGDSFTIIKSENRMVNGTIKDQRDHAQELMYSSMAQLTDESSKDEVMSFINLGTLGSRLRNTETIALELLTITHKWVRVRFMVSKREKNGKISHVLWLAEDIDSEKLERDKLIDMSQRALAASEAKSTFLSTLSREIMTPINTLLDTNDIIIRDSSDSHIIECSEKIRRNGSELLGMINDILDYSAIEAGKLHIVPADYDPMSAVTELADMIRPKAEEKHLNFVTEIKGVLPARLHGDCTRIKQVLVNLLTNAVKYTKKGTVTFEVRCEKMTDDSDRAMLTFTVKDTGIGMKPEQLQRWMSGPAHGYGGTNIGIEITQKLLDMMGSELEAESVYELGSKFSFTLEQGIVGNGADNAEKE